VKLWAMFEQHKKLASVVLIAIIAYSFGGHFLSIVVPGAEGVRAVNYGVQFGYGQVYDAASAMDLPSGYSWVSNQPSVIVVQHEKDEGEPFGGYVVNGPTWWYDHDSGGLRSEIQRPTMQDDFFGLANKQITYYKYVDRGDGDIEIKQVVVDMVPVDFVLQISAVPGNGIYTWENVKLWYALDSVAWMNSYANRPPPPSESPVEGAKLLSSNFRGGFPIIAWVGEYRDWVWQDNEGKYISYPPDENAVAYVQIDPSLEGRYIDLYTSPSSKYQLMLSNQILNNPKLVEDALNPDNLPDPRFAETVYFHLTLNKFGPYVKHTGKIVSKWLTYETWHPSVFYKVRAVYAVYGEYVYLWTNEEAENVGYGEWEARTSTKTSETNWLSDWLSGVGDWLSNPLTQLGLAGFGYALVLGVVALVLLWFVGLPKGLLRRGAGLAG